MAYSSILYLQQTIDGNMNEDEIKDTLKKTLSDMKRLYSYAITVIRKDNVSYLIRYAIHENERYNTLEIHAVISQIIDTIIADKVNNGKYIIGYNQPPLDMLIELYEPLVCKLAKDQARRWKALEYDDLCQICRMTIVILYNKGYYIHKKLIERSFHNAVLIELRRFANYDQIVSLESTFDQSGRDDANKLFLKDVLSDIAEENAQQDQEEYELNMRIFEDVKNIIVNRIGERAFEQVLNDYKYNHTTSWSRMKVNHFKKLLKDLGMTRSYFNSKYGN